MRSSEKGFFFFSVEFCCYLLIMYKFHQKLLSFRSRRLLVFYSLSILMGFKTTFLLRESSFWVAWTRNHIGV